MIAQKKSEAKAPVAGANRPQITRRQKPLGFFYLVVILREGRGLPQLRPPAS